MADSLSWDREFMGYLAEVKGSQYPASVLEDVLFLASWPVLRRPQQDRAVAVVVCEGT